MQKSSTLKCKALIISRGGKCVVRKDIGPIEFINYMLNAEYIITNSFHATAFAVIFNKQFCVVPHSSTGSRVIDLLTTLNLQEVLVREKNVFQRRIISYKENKLLTKQLSILKNTAKDYLIDALEL